MYQKTKTNYYNVRLHQDQVLFRHYCSIHNNHKARRASSSSLSPSVVFKGGLQRSFPALVSIEGTRLVLQHRNRLKTLLKTLFFFKMDDGDLRLELRGHFAFHLQNKAP